MKVKQDSSWETNPGKKYAALEGTGSLVPGSSFPSPAPHFSVLFCVIIKGLPLPLPLLSICGHCQRAEICVSQSSYRITKDPKLAKKGAKNSLQQHTIYGRKSKTAQMECKVWILGDGTSKPGLCPLFCLGGKTCRLGGYRIMSKKLALIMRILPSGVSPGNYEEKTPFVKTGPIFPF